MQDVKWVECGKIGRAIGLKGDCSVFWQSGECPVETGGELFIQKADSDYKSYKVAALRMHGRLSVVRFEGINDRESASSLTNSFIYIPEEELAPLEDGEYYSYQILGMDVFTEDENPLGKVVRIFTAGENDVYEVMPEGGKNGDEIMLPAIADVVLSIDVETNKMTVRPMEGMV